MTNSHLIDYFVITAADVTALFLAWFAGKDWIKKQAKEISNQLAKIGKPVLVVLGLNVDVDLRG